MTDNYQAIVPTRFLLRLRGLGSGVIYCEGDETTTLGSIKAVVSQMRQIPVDRIDLTKENRVKIVHPDTTPLEIIMGANVFETWICTLKPSANENGIVVVDLC